VQIEDSSSQPCCIIGRHPQVREIEQALYDGVSQKRIAGMFGVADRTVNRHAKQHMRPAPILRKPSQRYLVECCCIVGRHPQVNEIEQALYRGAYIGRTTRLFGLGQGTVQRHREHMIPPPPPPRKGSPKRSRNSLRADPDGTSVWLKLLPFKLDLWTRVDYPDLKLVQRYNWECWTEADGRSYANASQRTAGHRLRFRIHRLLTEAPQGLEVDHINGDSLDNRRSNLRVVTRAQNSQNRRGADRDSRSGIRGVRMHRSSWQASLRVGNYHSSKNFPGTPEGLVAATEWVKQKRAEVMPFATG